jgi:predicted ATPase/DNA-binding SARP family transcriptional activator
MSPYREVRGNGGGDWRVRIGILGPLEVRDTGGELVPVGGARLRGLLIRLAISAGRPVPVDRLAEDLWDADPPADPGNAVQALVSRLRGVTGREAIEHGPAGYRLAVAPGDVDAWAFEQLVATARGMLADADSAAGAAALRQALGMWRGPALADVADAAFAAPAIARLSELRLAALEDRIDADLALGDGAALVPEIEEVSGAHPLRERLRGQLMRALYAAGRQADALGVYEDTRQALATSLGVDPSPALAAVHLAILRGELPAGPAVRPAASGSASPSPAAGAWSGPAHTPGPTPPRLTNLPAQLTSFVGRDDELARVAKLLAEARLVTLTGPGGAGKTRLSVEAASRLADQVPDGVWFVPLAPVRDAFDVPQAVLVAMGAVDSLWPVDPAEAARLAALEPLDRLAEVLAAQRLVLVLDNCEHVVDAVARLAARVLADAPGVRILATSREPLSVTGETLCPVPSLPLPPPDADLVDAAASPSVRLFADRATAVRPGFTLDEQTAGPVVRICRALDGIPLAIELAAARVRALTLDQVADRLDDRFALLSVGSRAALPQHQTLRAIVDWSWDLLDGAERTVLRRLSVFSGGAAPEGAEQVCALGGAPGQIIDVIASLVDKSLVTAQGQRHVRYRLLETVRAYAADRLAEAGEADQVAEAHARYFLDLAEQAEPKLRSADQLIWLDRLMTEHGNCSAALRYVIAAGDAPSALRFVGALAWFWIMRDFDTEAGEWATAALRLAGDAPPPGLADAYAISKIIATISQAAGHGFTSEDGLRDTLGQLAPITRDTAHPLLTLVGLVLSMLAGDDEGTQLARAAAEQHPDPWIRGATLMFQGYLALSNGDIDSAAAAFGDGYARFQEMGERWGLAICLSGQAEVAMGRGAPADAVRLLEEAREIAENGLAGNWGEMLRIPLGRARAQTGDIDGARADIERGVRSAKRVGEQDDQASGYVQLSEIARLEGDLPGARRLLERAREVAEAHTKRPDMHLVAASAYTKLGCVAEQEGDLPAAARWHARALGQLANVTAEFLPSNPTLASVVEGIAALSAARGECVRAAELLGLAHTLQGFGNAASLEVKRAEAAIAANLDEADFAAAYTRGRELTREDALTLTP